MQSTNTLWTTSEASWLEGAECWEKVRADARRVLEAAGKTSWPCALSQVGDVECSRERRGKGRTPRLPDLSSELGLQERKWWSTG